MFTKPTHYGKEIGQLSEKEIDLLELDTIMSMMFDKISEVKNEIERMMLLKISSQISDKRVELCSELLESPHSDEDEFVEFVETTRYSYGKFLKDVKKNMSMVMEQERLSMLN